MTRPIKAQINLAALKHNYQLAKQLNAGPALAVIKANAYGHGAVACAQAVADVADGYAVASLEEARQLREAGITQPILLLEGFFAKDELAEISKLDCWLVIHALWQVDALIDAGVGQSLQLWLKVDTGMHRLGLSPEDATVAYSRLKTITTPSHIKLMTHFANADDLSAEDTKSQLQVFEQLCDAIGFEGEVSVANSAAILSRQQPRQMFLSHWARPGLMLYGANPFYGQRSPSVELALKAVMTLSANIIAVRTISAGESIGYGSLYTAKKTMCIGVVSCGYADGYPRTAIDAPAMVAGQMTKVIGRVSMDMLFVDLQDIDSAEVGTEVELWGANVSVDAVADAANTLAYELLCNVKRVQFIYT